MKYITKGEVLLTLEDNGVKLTQFLVAPETFGVNEPLITQIKVIKQQFDWTAGIIIDSPYIQQMLQVFENYNIITANDLDKLNHISDDPSMDTFFVYVLAQDDITLDNQYGAVQNINGFKVTATFKNISKGTSITEDFYFDYIPLQPDIDTTLANRIQDLKQVKI